MNDIEALEFLQRAWKHYLNHNDTYWRDHGKVVVEIVTYADGIAVKVGGRDAKTKSANIHDALTVALEEMRDIYQETADERRKYMSQRAADIEDQDAWARTAGHAVEMRRSL